MRRLIAIMTCLRLEDRAEVLRRTWIQDVQDADVRFFLGHTSERPPKPDEVFLDVPDDYKSLRRKVQLMFRWAVDAGYDFVFKTDDDVYVIPSRLLHRLQYYDYMGRRRGPSRENDGPRLYGPAERPFCSGFGYWLSRRAADIVAKAPDNGDWAEDRFTGQMLAKANIVPVHDADVLLWPPLEGHFCAAPNPSCGRCVREYGHASVVCPHERPVIEQLHWWYKNTGFIPTNLDG